MTYKNRSIPKNGWILDILASPKPMSYLDSNAHNPFRTSMTDQLKNLEIHTDQFRHQAW